MTKPYLQSPNRDISDILSDNPMLSELYTLTVDRLTQMNAPRDAAITVFNDAWQICSQVVNDCQPPANYDHLTLDGDADSATLAYCVAWCILRVHHELIDVDARALQWLRERIAGMPCIEFFNQFSRRHADTLSSPLDFSVSPVGVCVRKSAMMAKQALGSVSDIIDELVRQNEYLVAENARLKAELQEERRKKSLPTVATPIKYDIQHVDTLAPAASSVSPQYHNR